jgi:hypothetical protein
MWVSPGVVAENVQHCLQSIRRLTIQWFYITAHSHCVTLSGLVEPLDRRRW